MAPITIDTSAPPENRPGSPIRPPISPITPPLKATTLPGDSCQAFTHTQQEDQKGIPPPAPVPIDFESNPDVIALKSAISVLQVQRSRAAADMQTLRKVKDDATREPEVFLKDLASGGVKSRDDGLGLRSLSDDDEDSDEDDQAEAKTQSGEPQRAWSSLPKPQDIVRCPPINWSQYAVVGDSLDRLHAEQVSNPATGAPATLSTNGTYEFKAAGGRAEKYTGVAAPFAPTKDKVDRKSKAKG